MKKKKKYQYSSFNTPYIMPFSDYHEINAHQFNLALVFPNVVSEELGFYNREYYGLFYSKGNKPSREEIIKALETLIDKKSIQAFLEENKI